MFEITWCYKVICVFLAFLVTLFVKFLTEFPGCGEFNMLLGKICCLCGGNWPVPLPFKTFEISSENQMFDISSENSL